MAVNLSQCPLGPMQTNGVSGAHALHTALRFARARPCGYDMLRVLLDAAPMLLHCQATFGLYLPAQCAMRTGDLRAAGLLLNRQLGLLALAGVEAARGVKVGMCAWAACGAHVCLGHMWSACAMCGVMQGEARLHMHGAQPMPGGGC